MFITEIYGKHTIKRLSLKYVLYHWKISVYHNISCLSLKFMVDHKICLSQGLMYITENKAITNIFILHWSNITQATACQ